ncbi:MAG: hypothetical protein A3A65_04195 [Candidatus Chisholmbacteria bacterium RIFCSPLOWO2_01_FULL_49_14]|uniref:Uncharacterized protein n=1 Tax=Candidatus Chisholmbacteria bacterium RIFCSPLOWO2_01_FULL_49_14 TaxID=1797593 RepID=A0A1G1VVG0_9BACT|nr:MAG: hypothetical protein A3A65_04195 [Candidatus Chisholmbacteria bacterium RIFCSPLOWO2_01_FULL_49_14]
MIQLRYYSTCKALKFILALGLFGGPREICLGFTKGYFQVIEPLSVLVELRALPEKYPIQHGSSTRRDKGKYQ